MYRPLLRKGTPMVDGHTGEWMIERMTGNAPQSSPHPANADKIYPAGKGERHKQKRRYTVRSAIKDGTLGMDIAQLGYDMGYKAVEAAVKALEGEQVESFIDSGSKVVDSTNCDEYIDDMKAKSLWE